MISFKIFLKEFFKWNIKQLFCRKSTTECFQSSHKSLCYHLFYAFKTIKIVNKLLIYPKVSIYFISKAFLLFISFWFYIFRYFSCCCTVGCGVSVFRYFYLAQREQGLSTVCTTNIFRTFLKFFQSFLINLNRSKSLSFNLLL